MKTFMNDQKLGLALSLIGRALDYCVERTELWDFVSGKLSYSL